VGKTEAKATAKAFRCEQAAFPHLPEAGKYGAPGLKARATATAPLKPPEDLNGPPAFNQIGGWKAWIGAGDWVSAGILHFVQNDTLKNKIRDKDKATAMG
jgi:hypothetical protein